MESSNHNLRSKIVVRNIPQGIEETTFFKIIDENFSDKYDWKFFYRGVDDPSVAFLNFNKPEYSSTFETILKTHTNISEKDQNSKLSIAFATQQKIPFPVKKDIQEGSINKDSFFRDFEKKLTLTKSSTQLNVHSSVEYSTPPTSLTVTPLMKHLRCKYQSLSPQYRHV